MKAKECIREGALVNCEGMDVGNVARVISHPELCMPDYFTVNLESCNKEVLLPTECIHNATDERLYLWITNSQIEALPDVQGREVSNSKGYIYWDLRKVINEGLNLARPVLNYW